LYEQANNEEITWEEYDVLFDEWDKKFADAGDYEILYGTEENNFTGG
jgi:hypothetical protein